MNKRGITIAVVLIFLLSACAPQAATPAVDPTNVLQTAEAAAFTMVALTEAAIPTNTPIPPTATESPTALPTLTSVPSLEPTIDPLLPTAATQPAGGLPTLAPQPTQSSGETSADNCNKALTSWKVPTARFNIRNETKPQGKVTLSLYVVTALGECGYLTDLSQGPVGSYSAGAFVDGKKDFKVFGAFLIQEGGWEIVIRNDQIVALGGCYPHC